MEFEWYMLNEIDDYVLHPSPGYLNDIQKIVDKYYNDVKVEERNGVLYLNDVRIS